ncbi:MAG: hypothetical protein Q9219_004083 [cf. Caloplaca sp. 3 TL-2023]
MFRSRDSGRTENFIGTYPENGFLSETLEDEMSVFVPDISVEIPIHGSGGLIHGEFCTQTEFTVKPTGTQTPQEIISSPYSNPTQPTPPKPHTYPVPSPGVYAPAITFFHPSTDTLDLPTQRAYFTYLSHHTPLTGLVILGTNAEPFLLSRPERSTLLHLARQCVPATYTLIAGVSGHSTSQVLEYISDDARRGRQLRPLTPQRVFRESDHHLCRRHEVLRAGCGSVPASDHVFITSPPSATGSIAIPISHYGTSAPAP